MPIAVTASESTDEQLVTACISGDREAFGGIVRRYQGLVTGMVYNRCRGDLAKSEELAHETFVVAWKNLPNLEKPSSLASWLCGIARNVTNSAVRDQNRPSVRETPLTEVDAESVESREPDPSGQAVGREREELVWQTLSQLPEAYREPMILFYRQEQSAAEVAQALGLTESTVRKRLQRGREILREHMAALIEDFLSGTTPNASFSMAVLAALPSTGAATVTKTVSGGTLLGTMATKVGGLLFWGGPLIGVFAGIFGIAQSYRAEESVREKRFVIKMGAALFVIIGFFLGLLLYMSGFRRSMSGEVFVVLTAAMWMGMAVVLTAYVWLGRRMYRRTVSSDLDVEVRPWPKAQVYLGPAIGLLAGTSWMLVLAARAGDWISLVVMVCVISGCCVWSTRALLREPTAQRRVLLTVMTVVFCLAVVIVNFRLRSWFVSGAGVPFGFPSGDAVPEFPTLATNLLLFAIGLFMILPTALMGRGRRVQTGAEE